MKRIFSVLFVFIILLNSVNALALTKKEAQGDLWKSYHKGLENEKNDKTKEVRFDKLVINITNYELIVNDVQIDTPPKELELIYHLASNPNRVYTRDQLLDEVWGFDYYGDSRTVDVHVKRLREKLEGISEKWSLKTVWGVGYKFDVK